MKIKEIFSEKRPVFSLEIFPPKPDYPLETIYQTLEELHALAPDYISVTYGAGGSSREGPWRSPGTSVRPTRSKPWRTLLVSSIPGRR